MGRSMLPSPASDSTVCRVPVADGRDVDGFTGAEPARQAIVWTTAFRRIASPVFVTSVWWPADAAGFRHAASSFS